jgi:protein arginine kinase
VDDRTSAAEQGLDWLDASGPHADVVLSTRVRLARNLQGHRFGPRARDEDHRAVLSAAREAAEAVPLLREGSAYDIGRMGTEERRILLERHLVSSELVGGATGSPPSYAALLLSSAESVGVMVNEEDHLRLQSLLSGFRLGEAWRLADRLDEEMGSRLPFAFHSEFGFLTSCPTNVGTGLRASVLMHLPGLVLTQEIAKVLQGISQVGLTFRGLYGEGSEVVGNFFQISNQTTLGKTEEDLIDHLQKMVQQVVHYESRARAVLLRDARPVIEDKVWRAYGLLRYARSISFDEVMNLLSGVRLGVSLKLLPWPSVFTLNQIMIFSQSAHLERMAGRPLGVQDIDQQRAEYVRSTLESDEERSAGGD